jgi:Lon protease-like protein
MDVPLFPLHAVLCPGIALPLHIFEPRYRLLTERCLESSTPFGIVLILDGREVGEGNVSIASVGTFAEIRESNRYPDGRYDLLVVGSGRFAIESVEVGREPYLVGKVTPLSDETGDTERSSALADRVMRRFVTYLQLLQPMEGETAEEIDVRVELEAETPASGQATEGEGEAEAEGSSRPGRSAEDAEREQELDEAARRLIIPDDPTTLSYLLSGIIQVDAVRRQQLLEAESTESRLAALDRLIDRELWMLRRRLRMFTFDTGTGPVRRN